MRNGLRGEEGDLTQGGGEEEGVLNLLLAYEMTFLYYMIDMDYGMIDERMCVRMSVCLYVCK